MDPPPRLYQPEVTLPDLTHDTAHISVRNSIHPHRNWRNAGAQLDLRLAALSEHVDVWRRMVVREHDEAEAAGTVNRHHHTI
jgi:hypothetical protein